MVLEKAGFHLNLWTVGGMWFTSFPSINIFHTKQFKLYLTLFYLCVPHCRFFKDPGRKGEMPLEEGMGTVAARSLWPWRYQVRRVVHQHAPCRSLQDYCLAVVAYLNRAATFNHWSWGWCDLEYVMLVGSTWSGHSMQRSQGQLPRWHCGYGIWLSEYFRIL